MGGEITEILGWLGTAGGGAGVLVVLYKLGILKVNGNGSNVVINEKLTHIETTQERVADILVDQTIILKTQKEVTNTKLDQVIRLQEKCLDKLDDQ